MASSASWRQKVVFPDPGGPTKTMLVPCGSPPDNIGSRITIAPSVSFMLEFVRTGNRV